MKTSVLKIVLLIAICSVAGACYYLFLYESQPGNVDPIGDLFGKNGESVAGKSYLDIIESEMSLINNTYYVTVEVASPLPTNMTDPSIFIEWGILIDSDQDKETGWNWSLIHNDIGPDHLLRLMLMDGRVWGGNLRTKMRTGGYIGYHIDHNVIILFFPKEVIGSPRSLNYVVAVGEYGERGGPDALLVADKAPNQGHYSFHADYVEIEPPSSLRMLKTGHATFFCGDGTYCDSRVNNISEGFESAYAYLLKHLPASPTENFTVYIYAGQSHLVKGLKTYSYFPSEVAEFFSRSGAPRPLNYVMHISPFFQWKTVAHELTHAFIEEQSGNAYQSIKWLDEGLAEYLSYRFVKQTQYAETAELSRNEAVNVLRWYHRNDRLFNLASISTEQQWGEQMRRGYTREIYAQAFITVEYLCETYGLDKCLEILVSIYGGESQEQAVQSALRVSLLQIETGFREYLETIFD